MSKTVTVAAIYDFGPGMSETEADAILQGKLTQAVDYYLEAGIDGERFKGAEFGPVRVSPVPSLEGLKARRIEAEVTFA